MKKKFVMLFAAWTVFALVLMSSGAAYAGGVAGDMAPGTTWTTNPRYITFGKYNGHDLKWRVLDVYTSDGVTSDYGGPQPKTT